MAADLVTIATTAVLSQFLGPTAKHLGEQALERGKQVAAKATAYLIAVGREPQPVEPKLLLPLVQTASLETDSMLADLWAALLANAADPAQQSRVQPSFTEVLRQLTSLDAVLLKLVGEASLYSETALRVYATVRATGLKKQVESSVTGNEVNVAFDNLERLGLCRSYGSEPPQDLSELLGGGGRKKMLLLAGNFSKEKISITHMGIAFLTAVTPPPSQ